MENIIKTHVDRWYRLTKNLSAMTLNFRTQGNHIIVKLDSLKNEIEERDKIIRTQRKDYENEKDQYENQLKVLESALADSIPRNKTLSKYEPQLAKVETNQQIQQLTKDLAAQEQQYQKLKIENQRLSQNLKLLNSGANDFQQTLTNLNNEIAKKEDEILSLRWLTQDLAAERNGLEQKIQTGAKDPNFTSVTPQRQMNYDIDLSAFLDGDEDVSDDAVENGMMFLEMNDDADINPEVAKKLAEALEAVRKVTQFANDRDYEAKQLEDKEAEQQQQEQMEMKDEHEDVLSNLPPQQQKQQQRHNPDVRPGDSHDDIVLGRRKSLLAFHQAFDNEAKRRSQTYDNKLQKEDRRRSRHSSNRRRRSSVSNVVGLLLPLPDMGDPQSKSDIGGHKLEPEELDDDDKLFLNSLRRDVRAVTTARPDSAAPSPAPSPRNSPTQNANSPMGSAADEFELNIADAVDDELLNVNVIPPPRDQVQLNRQKDKDIELLKTQIDGKAQLVRDLKQNVQELTENRRRELMHFQGSLETMKSRCREWYEQLMARVREMELTYQDRVNEEVERRAVELHRELADERRRMRDEFEKQLAAQQQTTADLSSNPHEIDELSREIARLNEELEKFKGKYFDSEQQKIELADALDELKEEKFKMEEKLEELAAKVAIEPFANEELLLQSRNEARSHHAKSTGEWNDLVQKLREEKENQEAQYEEEFREFERMANEKVVQLEEYYVQQLQMKEVQVQQLQQLQQQQMLAKQQQPLQNEQVTLLTQEKTQLTQQMSAASSEIAKLNYQHKHDKEQLVHAKKRNESNESKISAYNASFIELAEKLKQLNDDTKGLRKEKDKKQRKCDKLEKQKKKLKQQIKQLNEKIDNITAVTKELVNLKHKTIRQTEQWDKERSAHEQQMNRIKQQMMQNASKKIESINKYNVEMNNLRSNIKTLQSRCVRAEAENEKLREPNESQSMLGSAAQWVPTNWWQTKKH
eukprot:66688_1